MPSHALNLGPARLMHDDTDPEHEQTDNSHDAQEPAAINSDGEIPLPGGKVRLRLFGVEFVIAVVADHGFAHDRADRSQIPRPRPVAARDREPHSGRGTPLPRPRLR